MSGNATVHMATLPTLDEVIGQRAVVERLKVAVAAAKADNRPLDHFLLCGPGGTGKTTLVAIVAHAMGVALKQTLASALNEGGMPAFLLDARDRDLLFLDEVHEAANLTVLYRAVAERRLFIPGVRKARSLPLAAFSCFAATTDPHCLPPSFRERFIEVHLDFYTPDELACILRQRAQAMAWEADARVFVEIGRLGRGVPRLALRLLTASREVCRSRDENRITIGHFEKACDLEGLDRILGLDRVEQQVLTFLDDAGGPLRLNVIASRLGLSCQTVTMHEGYLVRTGLLVRTEHGRTITPEGTDYLRHRTLPQPRSA